MAPKRSSEQSHKPNKPKKARTARQPKPDTPAQSALGAASLLAQEHTKDESELELEEAVFGKRSGEKDADIWGLAEEDERRRGGSDSDDPFGDEVDYEDEEETGLERLRDENVRFLRFPLLPPLTSLNTPFPSTALLRRRPPYGIYLDRPYTHLAPSRFRRRVRRFFRRRRQLGPRILRPRSLFFQAETDSQVS